MRPLEIASAGPPSVVLGRLLEDATARWGNRWRIVSIAGHQEVTETRRHQLRFVLNQSQKSALRRAALNGEYQLLLGGGASRDSLSPTGQPLPMSAELAEKLSQKFSVANESDDLLWRIYARAIDAGGRAWVYNYLREIFWRTQPPPWMDKYARFPWDRVWTLNLDDSFENSYARVRSDASRELTVRTWDSDFVHDRTLSVIHLHGAVASAEPGELVFSLSEYSNSIASRAAWPLAFRDAWGTSPFVVVGARLRDEPDIEAVIAQRRPGQTAPSIYVSPHITPGMESDLTNWGLVPFQGTAEEFADIWSDLSGVDLTQAPTSQEEVSFRVGRQFQQLRTNAVGKLPGRHDFLGGDPPLWNDIVSGFHAELDWIREATESLRRVGTSVHTTTALVYTGPRLSGRSAGLLALCRYLCQNAWKVLLYKADERLDVDAVLRFAADGRAVAVAFDGLADYAEDVDRLLRESRKAGLGVTCVAVDGPARSAGMVGRISGQYLHGGTIKSINARLTRTDAARLVDKLAERGRLGALEPQQDRQRIQHFRGRELFPSLAEVENAPAFGRRVQELVGEIEDTQALRLCLFAASAEKVERPLLVIDAARMMSMESEQVLEMVRTGPISALLWSDGHRILARQRYMALDSIMGKLGSRSAMSILNEGVRVLADRASRSAHRERNATVMLVGALMTYRNVVELFPGQQLELWYDGLHSSYGSWSGRFWEQRAIMSRHLGVEVEGALARAESYAERAVTLTADTYAYTTLGTVLCARASTVGADLTGRYYDRAFDAFSTASEMDPRNLVTWFAYLRHALPVLEAALQHDGKSPELSERIGDDWSLTYDNIRPEASKSEDTARDLVALKRRFDDIQSGASAAVPSPPEVSRTQV